MPVNLVIDTKSPYLKNTGGSNFERVRNIIIQHLLGYGGLVYSFPRRTLVDLVFTDEVTIENFVEEAIMFLRNNINEIDFPLESFQVSAVKEGDNTVIVDIFLTLKSGEGGNIIINL